MAYLFEWNPGKADANFRVHGVTFDEATEVFGDPLSLNMPDPDHSKTEARYIALGLSHRGRLLVVSYVERDARTRLISARLASRTERRRYEENPT
jgi:uncharacterized DUF497 family protein